jgi:hypothetical protein
MMNIELLGRRGKPRLEPLMLSRLLPAWIDRPLTVVMDGVLAAIYVLLLLPAYMVIGAAMAMAVYLRCAGVLLAR